MELAEKRRGHIDRRLPWAQPPREDASTNEEEMGLEQAVYRGVALLDFEPRLEPYRTYVEYVKCGSPLEWHCYDRSFLVQPKSDLQQVSHYDFWKHDEQDDFMSRLEDAANAKDESAFLDALKSVRWTSLTTAGYVSVAGLALKAGAYTAAHQIAVEGEKYHPDSSEIQKYACVLAPPEVLPGRLAPGSGHKVNREWLKAHSSEYSGQWVAVRDGELLGVADSLAELVGRVGNMEGVLLTKAL